MSIQVKIEAKWKSFLEQEFKKPYFSDLISFLRKRYQKHHVYPAGKFIFRAFDLCPLEKLSVVILGQDPYHGAGQADGLCFSVAKGIRMPPSLINIFKERQNDLNKSFPLDGNLGKWAEQGVLLLNATLTVEAKQAGSHQNQGWERFTDEVIRQIATQKKQIVFILWGAYAQKKGAFIDPQKHLIIKSSHPSPFSANRGFFGSRPFSRANTYLALQGKTPIEW